MSAINDAKRSELKVALEKHEKDAKLKFDEASTASKKIQNEQERSIAELEVFSLVV
jgi:ribosome recycling factor